MRKIYDYKGKQYTLQNTDLGEIPLHINICKKYWTDIDLDIQRELMENAVKNKTAFSIYDNKLRAFINFTKVDKNGYVHALWFEHKRFFSIFYDYAKKHTSYSLFYFKPHNGSVPFRFLFSDDVIKKYKSSGEPLYLRIGNNKPEFVHQRYIKNVVEM